MGLGNEREEEHGSGDPAFSVGMTSQLGSVVQEGYSL